MSADDKKSGPKGTATAKRKAAPYDYRIPAGSRWAGLWKMWAALGVVGLALSGVGYVSDPKRFAFSYLFAFMVALSVALGSLFFIIIERLTSAYWSVAVRRIAEFFASGFPALLVLFAPILLCMGSLFPWLHDGSEAASTEQHETSSLIEPLIGVAYAQDHPPAPPQRAAAPGQGAGPSGGPHHAEGNQVPGQPGTHPPGHPPTTGSVGHAPGSGGSGNHMPPPGHAAPSRTEGAGSVDEAAIEAHESQTMAKKAGYLNRNFFLLRIALYFSAWLFISFRYFRLSTSQDTSKDPSLTRQAQSFAPFATILFGLSLTFAAFDWLMSLEPTWFSTIFGVTYFAGCVVTIFATLTVVAMALREEGLLKNAVTIEHFHDLGKLLFGFLVFWAYVNFSQFMLIWYAALPEETTFYHLRWDVGPWAYFSLLIVIAHFVVPFFILISRNVKRRLPALRIGAVWLLVMHVVEIYWVVMPNYNHGESSVSWIDFACLAGVLGVYLAMVFRKMTQHPLIPVGDPRLARSLAFENA